MTAPDYFLAEQRERQADFDAEDRYLVLEEALIAATPFTPLAFVPCAFCSEPTFHGLCATHAVTRW